MARSGPVTKDTSTVALGLAQIRVGNSASNIASIEPVLLASNSLGAMASTKYTGNVDYWKLESGFPLLEDFTIPMRESSMLECEFKEISSYNLALARGLDPGESGSAASVVGGSISSTAGTVDGGLSIAVTQDAGPTSESWTILFSSATAFTAIGSVSGSIGAGTVAAGMAIDNGGANYFSIPADFFTGTWADTDTYTFSTTAYTAAGGAYADPHAGSIGLGSMLAPAYVRMEAVYTYPNGVNTMTIVFPRANATSSVEIDMQAEDNANVPLTFEAKRADSEVTGGDVVWDAMPIGRIVFG